MKELKHAEEQIGLIYRMFVWMGMMSAVGVTIVLLLLGSGCSTLRGSKGGYSGPPHLEHHSKDAINAGIHAFREHYGLDLKWKWDEWPVRVKTHPVVAERGRNVFIAYPGPQYEYVGAYYQSATGTVHVPERGLKRDTLVHEFGHALLHKNGYGAGTDHHEKYRWFFMQRFQYGGGPAL